MAPERLRYRRPSLDTNVWIDFLQGESASTPQRAELAREIFAGAEQGTYKIVASALVVAELLRDPASSVTVAGEELQLDRFFLQPFFIWVTVDLSVARHARDLARRYQIKKPLDAVHLACAIRGDADCFLTSDRRDLPPGEYDGLLVAAPYYPYDRPMPMGGDT